MSALTEKVAREHGVAWLGGSGAHERIGCECGVRTEQTDAAPMLASHVQHVAEVTEAAVRAAVAADIRDKMYTAAEVETVRSIGGGVAIDAFNSSLFLAARIAEGKQS